MLSQIGPYFIDEELATGGMARVFKGRLRGLGGFEKTLVIKQVRPELASDPLFLAMFVKEANTLVSLSHPHIVPVYELFSANGAYFMSMEYVEGATVAQLITRGPLAPTSVAHIGAQICDALDYTHRSFGMQHRDVTPRNVIVDTAGHARLLDFGISGVGSSVDEQILGSPGYAAPEQVLGEPLSDATDLFELGALLYEALSACAAFPSTPRGTLEAMPAAAFHALPPVLGTLCEQLLARDPRARPQSAREVGRTLRGYLAAEAPQGVVEAVQAAVADARAHRTPSSPHAADALPESARPVPTTSLATSPVLTQILRTAGGSPKPRPPVALAPLRAPTQLGPTPEATSGGFDANAEPTPGTRKIRERLPVSTRPTDGAAWTRRGLRAWPVLALATIGLLGVLTARRRSRLSEPVAPPVVEPMRSPEPVAEQETLPETPAPGEPLRAPTEGPAGPRGDVSDAGSRAGSASIAINAEPWAEVRVDGRAQGTTPLRNLRLKPGVRKIELVCPPLGTRAELTLDVAPGDRGRLLVQLQASPPRTFLDGLRQVR